MPIPLRNGWWARSDTTALGRGFIPVRLDLLLIGFVLFNQLGQGGFQSIVKTAGRAQNGNSGSDSPRDLANEIPGRRRRSIRSTIRSIMLTSGIQKTHP